MIYHLHSNGFMYMPNMFDTILYEMRVNRKNKWPRKVLSGLGLSPEAIRQIVKGNFSHHVEGETVILTIG